ncbi:hypothetical protein YC2023_122527 [Brassica napus]
MTNATTSTSSTPTPSVYFFLTINYLTATLLSTPLVHFFSCLRLLLARTGMRLPQTYHPRPTLPLNQANWMNTLLMLQKNGIKLHSRIILTAMCGEAKIHSKGFKLHGKVGDVLEPIEKKLFEIMMKKDFHFNYSKILKPIVDVVQLINGHSITDRSVLHGVGVATTQRVLVHLQPKE